MKKLQSFDSLLKKSKNELLDELAQNAVKGGRRGCTLTNGNAWDIDATEDSFDSPFNP